MLLELHPLQTHKTREFQRGIEPTTLRDLSLNQCATGDSVVSKGEIWVYTRTASRSYKVK